ncbi:lyase family protein, partial [Campylobacter jejuni]
EELDAIIKGLEQVKSEIEQGKFVFDIKDEDIHMAIEKRLSEIIGSEIGGRLHTARSRNDQVATDFKLFVKKSHIELLKLLKELIQTMLEHAKV